MSTTIGYCRISTRKQSIDRQIRNIKAAYPDAIIFEEEYTGTKINRPKFNHLLQLARSGKVERIVFDSVSRMSRNAEEGFELYQELYNLGIELVFLKEPLINTETYKSAIASNIQMTGTSADILLKAVQDYLLALAREQIRLAFVQAQKEVDDLHQRTKEGIETARLNGKQIGRVTGGKYETRKAKAAKQIILKHSRAFNGTLEDKDVITLAKITRNTYYTYKKELKALEQQVI